MTKSSKEIAKEKLTDSQLCDVIGGFAETNDDELLRVLHMMQQAKDEGVISADTFLKVMLIFNEARQVGSRQRKPSFPEACLKAKSEGRLTDKEYAAAVGYYVSH